MKKKNAKQKEMIERLRLQIIMPAKGRALGKKKIDIVLLNSNYRYLGHNQLGIHGWSNKCEKIGLNLWQELQKLVKKEFGEEFDLESRWFSGYMGVMSNDSWHVISKKDLGKHEDATTD